jgi:hypothetical protein
VVNVRGFVEARQYALDLVHVSRRKTAMVVFFT